jgi:monofunctional biosynthetic peptidoglycan transglycosylase
MAQWMAPTALTDGEPPALESSADAPRRSPLYWVVLPFLLVAVLIASSYVARSRLVLGPILQQRLVEQAAARDIDLFIDSMEPAGFFGVRFEGVRARLYRGHYVLDTRLERLEIRPSALDLLEGRLIPETLMVRGGAIVIDRQSDARRRPSRAPSATLPPGAPPKLTLIGREISVELRAGLAFASTKPLQITQIEAVVPLSGAPLPEALSATGVLPDGGTFKLATESAHERGGKLIVLTPTRRARLDEWFSAQLPFYVSTDRIELCAGCEGDEIRLNAVDVRLPTFGKGLLIVSPNATLRWDAGLASLDLPDVAITGLRDPDLGIVVSQTRFVFDATTGDHEGLIDVTDRQQGTLQVTWRWEAARRWWSARLNAGRFTFKDLLTLLELDPIVSEGALIGSFDATFDGRHKLLILEPALTAEGLNISLNALSSERLKFERIFFGAHLLIDLKARALSLVEGRLTLGQASPLRFNGRLQQATRGWSFDLDLLGQALAPSDLIAALPSQVARPLVGASLAGLFDMHLKLAGHSAFPESLRLKLSFDGDVRVARDAPQANVAALAAPGPPAQLATSELIKQIDPAGWLPYAELPSHIPRTLLAAEDSAFFRHKGFDFGGVRRAMVHNLKVGKMERGGSTITQQLIKNLYLSRDRTVVRKLQEAYLTWRLEDALSKQRILEIYLNVVHWGREVYGLHAAAKIYFQLDAKSLSIEQMALLSAILPNPERFGGHILSGHIASSRVTKFEHIISNLRYVSLLSWDEYYDMHGRALYGKIGGLDLKPCDDDGTAPMGSPPCSSVPDATW